MNTLLERAQSGNEFAFRRLCREYEGILRAVPLKYFPPAGLSRDDLFQEALVGFWKAVHDFRDGRNSGFANFAELCVERQVITAIKTATRQKHLAVSEAEGLEDQGAWMSARGSDPAEIVEGREEARMLLDCVRWDLSDLERESFVAIVILGESYEDAAVRLGVGEKAIDNALQRARRRLGDLYGVTHRTGCVVCDAPTAARLCRSCAAEQEVAMRWLQEAA